MVVVFFKLRILIVSSFFVFNFFLFFFCSFYFPYLVKILQAKTDSLKICFERGKKVKGSPEIDDLITDLDFCCSVFQSYERLSFGFILWNL